MRDKKTTIWLLFCIIFSLIVCPTYSRLVSKSISKLNQIQNFFVLVPIVKIWRCSYQTVISVPYVLDNLEHCPFYSMSHSSNHSLWDAHCTVPFMIYQDLIVSRISILIFPWDIRSPNFIAQPWQTVRSNFLEKILKHQNR